MKLSTDDYIAIQQLYARYAFAADECDLDAWLATWVPDGVMTHPDGSIHTGHQALRAQAEPYLTGGAYHWNCNLVIQPTDYGASGKCYLLRVFNSDGPPVLRAALYYRDELVNQDGNWLFRRREVNTL